MQNSSNTFNEDYFERGISTGLSLYTNYRWIPELTIPMCHEMARLLHLSEHEAILDFGCSKGYVVKGFRLLHYNAYGVDISEYAVSHAPEDVREYLQVIQPGQALPLPAKSANRWGLWDWIVSKDVLEHIDQADLPGVLSLMRGNTEQAYIVVPLGDGTKYNIASYELDVTHRIRQPLEWWTAQFKEAGFRVEYSGYSHGRIKDNWASTPNGNGFFVLL